MSLCTIAEVEDVLSDHGVRLATDDERGESMFDSTKTSNAIERAEQKIYQYVALRYSTADLVGNTWAKWACAVFAAVQLMRRRGGTVPPGLMDEYQEYLDYLTQVKDGQSEIPGLSQANEPGLTMSNLVVDQRFRSAKTRVVRSVSAGENSSLKPRRTDTFEGFDW